MDARTDDRGGLGRRNRPRKTPKGRQVEPQALAEVRALLGERERRRDLLIEHLHLSRTATAISPPRISPRWRRR